MKNLSRYCEFGRFLEEALRDKFVCGLNSERIKQRLLTEDGLTFERACEIAVGMELAGYQTRVMMLEGNIVRVNQLDHKSKSHGKLKEESSQNKPNKQSNYMQANRQSSSKAFPAKQACKRCTRAHKDYNRCPAINWRCYTCNQMGHTAKSPMCKNKVHNIKNEEGKKTQEEDNDVLELELININKIGESENSSLKVEMYIENQLVYIHVEVDSGACKSVIYFNDYREKFSNISLEAVNFKLKVVTGENVKIVGQIPVNI